jgi:hypothetical protein
MKIRRLCIVTMIGGVDLVGDLVTAESDEQTANFMKLEHPCSLQRQGSQVILGSMTRQSPVISGNSIVINMRSVLWISEPNQAVSSAWQAQRAGLIVPSGTNDNHDSHSVQ